TWAGGLASPASTRLAMGSATTGEFMRTSRTIVIALISLTTFDCGGGGNSAIPPEPVPAPTAQPPPATPQPAASGQGALREGHYSLVRPNAFGSGSALTSEITVKVITSAMIGKPIPTSTVVTEAVSFPSK